MFEAFLILIFGLALGSFLNVVIYRLRAVEGVLWGRSHCVWCKKPIAWYDLIPVLSFVLLRAKCRACGKPISWQYPLVEVLTAGVLLALWWKLGITWEGLFWAIALLSLLVIAVYDLEHSLIPREMVILGALGALITLFWHPQLTLDRLLGSLLAGAVLGIIVLAGKGKLMGAGDIEVALLLGLMLGIRQSVLALFLSFFLGGIVALVLLTFRLKKMKDAVPFAPFLALATFISFFWGQNIINWYLNVSLLS